MEIHFLQALPKSDGVSHRRNAAGDRACADRHQDPAMLPEFPELLDIIFVRAAPLDETDIDGPVEGLLVIERRDVEINEVDQLENPLVDVEQRHVASETSRQGACREPRFCHVPALSLRWRS